MLAMMDLKTTTSLGWKHSNEGSWLSNESCPKQSLTLSKGHRAWWQQPAEENEEQAHLRWTALDTAWAQLDKIHAAAPIPLLAISHL